MGGGGGVEQYNQAHPRRFVTVNQEQVQKKGAKHGLGGGWWVGAGLVGWGGGGVYGPPTFVVVLVNRSMAW